MMATVSRVKSQSWSRQRGWDEEEERWQRQEQEEGAGRTGDTEAVREGDSKE
jgi:hypothetical protein